MDIRKLAAMALSAVLAAAVLVPAPALAVNTANAENPSDGTTPEVTGSANVTQLTLIAEDPDANLASNGGTAWVAQHAKVQVPVAINFVVTGTGDIEGPSSAEITNYSSFPVSVSNIKATAASNSVTFASTAAGATAADQVYLQFQPGANATAVNLSQFTGANGAAPTSGEWNIGAGSASAGTSLALTDFSGHVGGFSSLDPLSQEAFATIAWTIKAGSAQSVTLPVSLSAASASDLQAAGDAIRNGDVGTKAHYDDLVGQTMNVTLGNNSTAAVRLVDVSAEKGLVFMFESSIATARMNSTMSCLGGWPTFELRTSLNSGTLYTTYLQGMEVGGVSVTPATVTNYSLDYAGDSTNHSYRVVSSNDKFWLLSVQELVGTWPLKDYSYSPTYYGSSIDENCEQFAYFRSQGFSESTAWPSTYQNLWLRSACPDAAPYYVMRTCGGYATSGFGGFPANSVYNVRPCFAL